RSIRPCAMGEHHAHIFHRHPATPEIAGPSTQPSSSRVRFASNAGRRRYVFRHEGRKVPACAIYPALHGADFAPGRNGGFLITQSGRTDEKECLSVRVGESTKPCTEILGNAPANLIRRYGRRLGLHLIQAYAHPIQFSAFGVETVAENGGQPGLEV